MASTEAPNPMKDISSPNPIREALEQLNLSPKELAEKLNTSFYAVSRWERGDMEPTSAIIEQLTALLTPDSEANKQSHAERTTISFASSGVRSKSTSLPLFTHRSIQTLNEPRESLLRELKQGEFFGDGEVALASILTRRTTPASTLAVPLDEEISAGKNTYTYDAHTYHTKVPPQGIASVISKYLPEGGLVLDPFGGSGMTGVAARYLGFDAVINELSPAACFIAHNFLQSVDVDEFNACVAQIMQNLSDLRRELYSTECRECGSEVEQLFTVWSYELECKHCHQPFILWDHCRKYGSTVREHKLLKKFPCPHCGEEVNKSLLKRNEAYPVFLGYKCCSKRIMEHPLTAADKKRAQPRKSTKDEYAYDAPKFPLPEGVNLNQPKRHGLDAVEKFYTDRNLVACAAIWREIRKIDDPNLAAAVGFVFTSLYQRVTRLSEYRFWGGSGNTANFNVPQISNEANVFVTFERKAKSIADHFMTTATDYGGRAVVRTGSATDLSFLPDNSVDLIFTDPPFGANINYSEMNVLWEAWLGEFTNSKHEAIMNKIQGKTVDDYQMLMTESLSEAYRVLRPNHWMVLVFMNSSEKVWTALHSAIIGAGFSIEKVSIFDKQHGTFKQFVSDNTAGADLMIHCKKISREQDSERFGEKKSLSIFDFIELQKEKIPILPFLHVKREAEIDYRTLYSRYLSECISNGFSVLDFSKFRAEAKEKIEGKL